MPASGLRSPQSRVYKSGLDASGPPAQAARQIDNQQDQQNQTDGAATDSRTSEVETTTAEDQKKYQN
jgi:hypothetical protein